MRRYKEDLSILILHLLTMITIDENYKLLQYGFEVMQIKIYEPSL